MRKRTSIITAGLVMCLIAIPAQAQDAFSAFEQTDRREVHLGVSIPFGATGKTQAEKPKLQLGVRSYAAQDSYDWALNPIAHQDYTQRTIGLTFSDNPSLMINNQELQLNEDEQLGLNTTETILVGVAAIAVTVILIGTISECTDGHDNIITVC